MLHSARGRHKHRQAVCKLLQHYCRLGTECNTSVVRMVHTGDHIPGALYRRYVCELTRCLGEGKSEIVCQWV